MLAGLGEPGELACRPRIVVGLKPCGIPIDQVAQFVAARWWERPDEHLTKLASLGGLVHPEGEGFAGITGDVVHPVSGAGEIRRRRAQVRAPLRDPFPWPWRRSSPPSRGACLPGRRRRWSCRFARSPRRGG